jgi:hypothetical protein
MSCGVEVLITYGLRHMPSFAAVAQLVERVLGKDEVMSSSLISSSEYGYCSSGCLATPFCFEKHAT